LQDLHLGHAVSAHHTGSGGPQRLVVLILSSADCHSDSKRTDVVLAIDVRHRPHRIKTCLCVPVDPSDTKFDCVGVNGEGSYYTAVVGGVDNVVDYVSAGSNVPECASASHLQTPPEYKYSLRPPFSISPTRTRTPSSCKSL